jgi:hypothetical protein
MVQESKSAFEMLFGPVSRAFPLLLAPTNVNHSKTLYYDVQPFLYYVMVSHDG